MKICHPGDGTAKAASFTAAHAAEKKRKVVQVQLAGANAAPEWEVPPHKRTKPLPTTGVPSEC